MLFYFKTLKCWNCETFFSLRYKWFARQTSKSTIYVKKILKNQIKPVTVTVKWTLADYLVIIKQNYFPQMDWGRYIYLAHLVIVAIEQHKKTCLKLSIVTQKGPGKPKKMPQKILQNRNSKSLRSKKPKKLILLLKLLNKLK